MTAVTRQPGRVGESARRIDGAPKTTGEYVYGGDLSAPGMLWGVTLRSPHAAARIRSIDISAALAAPGVHAVLTAADVPGRPTFGLEIADQPVLAGDEVRYEGEAVALVAADRVDRARAALRLIRVEYEPLEPLADMELALDPAGAPAARLRQRAAPRAHRARRRRRGRRGRVGRAASTRRRCRTRRRSAPRAGSRCPAGDGGVDLFVATQWLHVDRQQIAPCLDLPEELVRVTLAGVGGAFGAREDVSVQIHACLLALRTGPAGQDDLRARGVVPRPRPSPSVAHLDPLRRDPRRQARRRRRAPAARRRRLRLLVAGGARERLHVRRRAVRGAERAHRGHRRLHEQPAVRRDARLRRAPGVLRARVGDGRARRGAAAQPARAAAPQRRLARLGAPHRPGADREARRCAR